MNQGTKRSRPRAVTEIATILCLQALGIAIIGLVITAGDLAVAANGTKIFPWLEIATWVAALILALIGSGFYCLQRWAYPITRFLVGPLGLSIAALWGGSLTRKIESPEVREAFGLPPLHSGARGTTMQGDEPATRPEKN
jgi:hypothetical protein